MMPRIVFLNPFSKHEISGGIKTTYHHAGFLCDSGMDVCVYSPDGPPAWLARPEFAALTVDKIIIRSDDIVVFTEILDSWLDQALRQKTTCRKIMFCQNHYKLYLKGYTSAEIRSFGLERIITVGETAKKGLNRIMGPIDIEIIPPVCDERMFWPEPQKELRVLISGLKWQETLGYMGLVQRIFLQKYPDLAHIPWAPLGDMTEQQVATEMRRAAVFLFLGRLEALPITALEAMASGCAVAGFHGGGGRDYATQQNGFWHSPEDILGLVDSVAVMLRGLYYSSEDLWRMVAEGRKTAKKYEVAQVRQICVETYKKILHRL